MTIKKIIPIDRLDLPGLGDIEVDSLRLDTIDPVISGNKWFKLKHYLNDASQKECRTLITFGGAYSNHVIATACAANQAGFDSIGIIRGERPLNLSETLQKAQYYGMQLHFIGRNEYKRKHEPGFLDLLREKFPGSYLIPEGGAGPLGIQGCEEIPGLVDQDKYDHILCAVGTGTMYLGIANASAPRQFITGIPVLKGMPDLLSLYKPKLKLTQKINYCGMRYEYHFGGYAKKNPELISFMNWLYECSGIPTDFVYTAKLFYAAIDLAAKKYFPPGSKILLIHSGGLQGNLSLPPGSLKF